MGTQGLVFLIFSGSGAVGSISFAVFLVVEAGQV